jgi:hypothetical protein
MACLGVGRLEKEWGVSQGCRILTIDVVVQSVIRQFEGRELGVRVPLEGVVSITKEVASWSADVSTYNDDVGIRSRLRKSSTFGLSKAIGL